MGLLKTILFGRPHGIRRTIAGKVAELLGLGSFVGGKTTDAAASDARAGGISPEPSAAPEPAERALGLGKEAPKDVTPPDGYEVVLHKDALEAGKIIEIIIGGTAIAVANVGGTFYAISNTCAHADGPLGEGTLEGTIVTCPYHGWQFDVRDGGCRTTPGANVPTYPVQVVGDAVCVKL